MTNFTHHPETNGIASAGEQVRHIGLDALRAKLDRHDDFVFVMAMDQRRFEMAHIEGSISFETLEAGLTSLSRSTEIVLYCTHPACVASKLRAGMLAEAGFTNISRFAGGLTEWSAAGLPVRQGLPQPA